MKKFGKIGLVVLLVAVMAGCYIMFREKPTEGSKEITIEVVNKEGKSTRYELKTDAEFLGQAMEEAEGLTVEGEEGPYGMMVSAVNGERAVYEEDGAFWGFSVNGEDCMYGIDQQPIEDKDAFQVKYTLAE